MSPIPIGLNPIAFRPGDVVRNVYTDERYTIEEYLSNGITRMTAHKARIIFCHVLRAGVLLLEDAGSVCEVTFNSLNNPFFMLVNEASTITHTQPTQMGMEGFAS